MSSPLLRFLRRVAACPGDTADADLLRRFASRHDEAAFTVLVERHGPMVLGVCQRLLRNHHDAEDAFQATFLVLAKKARSVGRPELLGNWLYGVAYRTALKARSRIAERRLKEGRAVPPAAEDPIADVVWADLRPLLDEEIGRLPDRFRVPFVLCYLQGRTNEEAARALGCPKGTVLSRLATARERLRSRLTRRGIVFSAGVVAAALSAGKTSAAIPPALVGPTVKAALGVAAGQAAAGLVSAEAAALMKATLRAMLMSKLKVAALAALALTALGGVLLTHRSDGGEPVNKVPPAEAPAKAKPPKDEEAIRGTWRLVRLDQVGHEPTKDEQAAWDAGAFKAVITADRIVLPGGAEAAYKLDPLATPKRIDLTLKNDTETVTVPGIYSLDGDELKLCIGRKGDAKPPAGFEVKKAGEGEFPTSWTFKRDKPAPGGDKGGEKKGEDAAAKELKAMEGKWKVVGVEEGGRKVTEDDVKGMKWTFEGSELVPDNPRLESTERYRVKLDPGKDPKQIDLLVLEGQAKGKAVEGIYKIAGGRLTICLRDEKFPEKGRPKEFTGEKGSDQCLITLEQVKK